MTTVRRSLLIGINYTGTLNELSGCINDSENLSQFLVKNGFFVPSEVVMMNDKKTGDLYPTNANIWKQFNSLVNFANQNIGKNVFIFVSYSGHGSSVVDKSKDEVDGMDEVLCPIDFETRGFITDDSIKTNFINKLPANVKLIFLSDSCNSGTVLDLKYNYTFDKRNTCKVSGDLVDTKCNACLISGCRDDQTSADAYIVDNSTHVLEYQGAMTASFIAVFNKTKTCYQLIQDMRTWLTTNKYTQVPQFSSTRLIDIKKQHLF